MISIVTWLWHDPDMIGPRACHVAPGPEIRIDMQPTRRQLRRGAVPLVRTPTSSGARAARSFKPAHVLNLARLFRKFLPQPHRFICITDTIPVDLGEGVEWLQTPEAAVEVAKLRTPEGPRFPSCYRRLWVFSEAARASLGEQILLIDIDLVPVGNLTPIVDRDEDFVGWRPYRDWGKQLRFGGGIYLLKTGTRTKVWDEFAKDPHGAIRAARGAGFRGSDQAWLSYKLGDKEPYWGKGAGIYSIRDLGASQELPRDARLVQFNGPKKCWDYGPHDVGAWVYGAWNAV
jgi:hypothetical protein